MKSWDVTVVGAGLAGSEAAWQLAQQGQNVRLLEMKPHQRTPAQTLSTPAELVCSNSLRSANPLNAVGLLKEEMGALDSLIIAQAKAHRVPAGDALAVDREAFSLGVQEALEQHPNIVRQAGRVDALPNAEDGPVIVATGPLTADALAQDIAAQTGIDRLYFYDAIAPIVAADSLNHDVIFAASRYSKGDGDDYLNCPLDKDTYEHFIQALRDGDCMPLHSFEKPKYFQGCLPIEVVAAQGPDTLRFGAMKPVGLTDPRTGRWPYAVVQLRKEDVAGQAYNLVGFQTKLKYPEQTRIFRMIPGLEHAEFLRLGAIHRNTYLDSPRLLDDQARLQSQPHVHFAGQITGVEGYVESAAHGLLTARLLAARLGGQALTTPPLECALGALWAHVCGTQRPSGAPHEPQNINWAMFPPRPPQIRKHDAKTYRVERARAAFAEWTSAFPAQAAA